ncbi:hypothetical protein WOLCODRAFT_168147 [Wolfiporia cocos MD-104 SS10]|uniref:BTB domain-containing protein n=1 Tax=Wolfiporia cocos (strain MD-104) TaxID=742152 RepID=A0A2H3JDK5_WOLCO|nr:hypothetical protein WOLCODRAFT_168147 [Wolfiporia cocos MD-104 SS10]
MFYFEDGNVHFRIKNTVYKLYRSRLIQKSPVLRTMLSLPTTAHLAESASGQDLEDGSSDERAFRLDRWGRQVTTTEFDHLLSFIHPDYDPHTPVSLTRLVDALKQSHYFDIIDIKEMVTLQLNGRPDLKPALRLFLARTCLIYDWIEPAIRQILQDPFDTLTFGDVELIGLPALHPIECARAQILRHRGRCAVVAPRPMHSPIWCLPDRSRCEDAWLDAWWGGFNRQGIALALLHPDHPVPGSTIIQRLPQLDTGAMSERCRELTLQELCGTEDQRSKLLKEEDIIEATVVKVRKTML